MSPWVTGLPAGGCGDPIHTSRDGLVALSPPIPPSDLGGDYFLVSLLCACFCSLCSLKEKLQARGSFILEWKIREQPWKKNESNAGSANTDSGAVYDELLPPGGPSAEKPRELEVSPGEEGTKTAQLPTSIRQKFAPENPKSPHLRGQRAGPPVSDFRVHLCDQPIWAGQDWGISKERLSVLKAGKVTQTGARWSPHHRTARLAGGGVRTQTLLGCAPVKFMGNLVISAACRATTGEAKKF